MLSNKDIRVEGNYLIINGEKHLLGDPGEIDALDTRLEAVENAITYKAGDVIENENVVAAAIGTSTSDCYFSVPISKPVSATSVSITMLRCKVYYANNQMEEVTGASYVASIKNGSILIRILKADTFTENGRYTIDAVVTFTFS